MGVRGLTTYIAQNASKYLTPHELHDTDLVIDGDNLASILLKNMARNSNCAFGGDYDSYYIYVMRFFAILKKCNINAYVLLDGGYQPGKLRTVKTRLNQKICAIRNINPVSPAYVYFPLMLREVFVSALKDSGVKFMRCLFEADHELAILAKKLNCPVLSYDSDFYIYNVLYIPSVTLSFKVYKKVTKQDGDEEIYTEKMTSKAKRRRRRNLIPFFDMDDLNAKLDVDEKEENCYYFLDCAIYEMKNLAVADQLDLDLVPFLPAILGNDQCSFSKLSSFVSRVKKSRFQTKKKRQGLQASQMRVKGVMSGLKNQSKALIQDQIENKSSAKMKEKINGVVQSYQISDQDIGDSFSYFGFNKTEEESDNEELREDELELEEIEENSDVENNIEEEEEKVVEENSTELEKAMENLSIQPDTPKTNDPEKKRFVEHPEVISPWFKEMFISGILPRFSIDMLNLKIYINSPQIENFQMSDANEVARRIIILIHSILHNGQKDINLYYLTRKPNTRVLTYKTIKTISLPIEFDHNQEKNFNFFKIPFSGFKNIDKVFEMIENAPSEYRLYFLAIIYWSKYSKLYDETHLKSILICLLTLWVIDKKCGVIRSPEDFDKTFGKNLEKTKLEMAQQAAKQKPVDLDPYFSEKSDKVLRKKITKHECVVLLERFMPYLHRNTVHHKKHQTFSTTILHGFAEFQCILFHLNCLNALCNFPFEELKMHTSFKGFYLYNLYCNLNKRSNADYYLKENLFKGAKNWNNYYEYLQKLIVEMIEIK